MFTLKDKMAFLPQERRAAIEAEADRLQQDALNDEAMSCACSEKVAQVAEDTARAVHMNDLSPAEVKGLISALRHSILNN